MPGERRGAEKHARSSSGARNARKTCFTGLNNAETDEKSGGELSLPDFFILFYQKVTGKNEKKQKKRKKVFDKTGVNGHNSKTR